MLILPQLDEPLRVIGIDPGTTCLGVTELHWDLNDSKKVVYDAYTLKADTSSIYGVVAETHGDLVARINHMGDALLDIFQERRPHVVISESPFMGKFAQSFKALTECLWVVRSAVSKYDRHMPLYLVDPPTAKKAAGVKLKRKTEKEDVLEALKKRTDLEWLVDVNTLDEHAVDSTAVALYYLLNVV